jgi:hypothetical protein
MISPLYIAVATGSVECVKIIAEELVNVNIECGIEIKKRSKEEGESIFAKNERNIKRRTPL